MIWFSAEEGLMSTTASPCGPRAMPAIRKAATSGIRSLPATKAESVPIARIRAQASSVCCAMAIEAGASMSRSIQSLQPGRYLAHGDIGLVEQLAHGEEAVELAGEVAIGNGHAGFFQPCGIF